MRDEKPLEQKFDPLALQNEIYAKLSGQLITSDLAWWLAVFNVEAEVRLRKLEARLDALEAEIERLDNDKEDAP